MESNPMGRIEQLFRDCVDLEPAQRAAFLNERCDGEPEMRDQVLALLRYHDDADGILDQPATSEPLLPADPEVPTDDPALALIGQRIGDYQILDFLGHGGMGTVYLADQVSPVRRRVALKVLRDPGGGRDTLERFKSERQALAMMDHPNIARVFDAGALEDGRPYFTLEFIPGVPLLEYCDAHHSNLEDRLDLFRQICEGVQHAHQKGILHRDLKPSNILVTLHSGHATAKIIDFGVAKALNQKLTDKTIHTLPGFFVGTPSYMSPEQAAPRGRQIDARADVFSLGALLYELLTGAVPIDFTEAQEGGPAELQRWIQEKAPEPMSQRLAKDQDLAERAARLRSTNVAALARRLKGEMEWVVEKALEKEPQRRYGTVAEFSTDLQRAIRGEDVQAHPPEMSYRLKKVAVRHRRLFLASLAIIAVMLVASIVSVRFALIAQRERTEAVAAKSAAVRAQQAAELAAAEALRAKEVSGEALRFFAEIFELGTPQGGGTESLTVFAAMDTAAVGVFDLIERNPDVGAVVASTIGQFYFTMNEGLKARTMLDAALAGFRRASSPELEQYGGTAKLLGVLAVRERDAASAKVYLTESMDAYRRLDASHWDLPMVRHTWATALELEGKPEEARALRESILTEHADATGQRGINVAFVEARLGSEDLARGDLAAARPHLESALQRTRASTDVEYHQIYPLIGLAQISLRESDPAEAALLARTAHAYAEASLPESHPFRIRAQLVLAEATLELEDLAASEAMLSSMLSDAATPSRALLKALQLRLRIALARERLTDARALVAECQSLAAQALRDSDAASWAYLELDLAEAAKAQGDLESYSRHLQRAHDRFRTFAAPTHPVWTQTRQALSALGLPARVSEERGTG